jgi:type II secretory pathway pseudopilin PulG
MVSSAKEHIYMHLQGQGTGHGKTGRNDEGYAMAALLVTIAVMAIMMTVAMPAWRQQGRREKEAELIFRAGQYVHAIELFKRKNANAYPPNIDVLIKGRFLRKKFTDPMTKNGEFRLLTPQELNATPSRILQPGGAGGVSISPDGRTVSVSNGRAGSTDSRLGSGTALTGQGLGSAPTTAPGSGGTSGSGSAPSGSNSGSGFGGTGAFGQNGQIQNGPIAAVVSRSTDQSIRIFKGRDHYNDWIVTIEDVVPRQFLRQTQGVPNQPGNNQNRPQTPTQTPAPSTPSSPIR